MLTESKDTIAGLRELVQKHQICYAVWPELLLVRGKLVKVGFDLELSGTHEHGTSTFSPRCPKCIRTFEDLRKIAEWIMPKEERPSRYEIESYDRALRESAKRDLSRR